MQEWNKVIGMGILSCFFALLSAVLSVVLTVLPVIIIIIAVKWFFF